MSLIAMKSGLRAFERKVLLGVTALAGTGGAVAVSRWQENLGELALTRDQFIAETGQETVISGAYEQIASSLDTLGAVVSSGDKEAVYTAAVSFYTTLAQAHEAFAQFVPAEIRGLDKPPEEVISRVTSILGSALGL